MDDLDRTGVRGKWWRWPLVPLAALAGGFAAGALMLAAQWLFVMMSWGSTSGWYFRYLAPVLAAGACGSAMAYSALATAPWAKHTAAVVTLTIIAVIYTLAVLLAWTSRDTSTHDAVFGTITAVTAMGAAAYVLATQSIER